MKCDSCGGAIAKSAKKCPNCGVKNKKPILKKWWFLTVIVLLIIGIAAGCSGGDSKKEIVKDNESSSAIKSSEQKTTEKAPQKEAGEPQKEEKPKKEETSIEEQVLLEYEGVRVTAKEYTRDSIWGEGVKLLLENDSDRNVGFGCNALIVNNYMISDLFSETVAPGKKDNETIYFSSNQLEAAGIENVGQVEIYFYLFDGDTYETIYDAPAAVIRTSDFETMDTVPNDVGTELYNESGVRVVGKYVDEDSFWGAAILLYIENHTGRNIAVSGDDVSVNGFMVTSWLYASVYDGKMAIDDVTLLSSDLEENGIESIDTVELSFRIIDEDTFEEVGNSGPISFNTK